MRLVGARILVVDDQEDLVENLSEILTEEGADVRHATSGADALAHCAGGFDVALVDVRLPDTSGLNLLRDLRRCGDPLCEVILMTGDASLEDAIAAVKEDAYAYVLKPFDPDDLVASVGRALAAVRLEREARMLSARLAQSEGRLRLLVDTVQALLLILDQDGRVIEVNEAVLAATHSRRESVVGRSWAGEFVVEADRAAWLEAMGRVQGEADHVRHECRVLRRESDGTTSHRFIRWRISGHRSRSGSESGELRIYASGLDDTEARLFEQRARLAEKLAAVGTLAAGLAHEIRNPLNGASLQLTLLESRLRKVQTQVDVASPIAMVRGEIERLSRLVEDFLGFARPQSLRLAPVDLQDLVKRVVALEQRTASTRNIRLRAIFADGPLVLQADGARLEQVLLNLVRNALEAVDDGGNVTLRVGHDGAGARFEVEDDGPGIAPEHLRRIFEPFFSTKHHGTGLGMAICHSIIELHGGSITIDTRAPEARGTTFTVTLPRGA